jgi:hypothetical protein
LIGHDTRNGSCYTSNSVATQEVFENNLVSNCATLMYNNVPTIYSSDNPDHNVYGPSGNGAFVCGSSFIPFNAFASWRSCIQGDTHSTETANPALNADGSPQATSPAIGAGTNLTSLCTGLVTPLCSNILGVPRPAAGPWNAGAF